MTELLEVKKDDFLISTDKGKLDLKVIHGFLYTCYWSKGIPEELLIRAIENSVCFGLYKGAEQIGFARVVTDYATFFYLADVFILEAHRGEKLGVWLIETIVNHPAFTGIRTWTLLTADAHGLYAKFGFQNHSDPKRFMIRKVPYPYPLPEIL